MEKVHVYLLTKNALYYDCSHCGLKHSHGNEKESILGNWITRRNSHCLKKKQEIILEVNNFTIRTVF